MRRLLSAAALWLCFPPSGVFAAAANPYLDSLIEKARALRLHEERPWLLLLHYRARGEKDYESAAMGDKFFLAKDGRRDPAGELEADLSAFFEEPSKDPESQHPRCRFPARFAWLAEKLRFDLSKLPAALCPRYEEWREALDPGGLTMVFADAYLDNPSSMYGHTFLRVNRRDARPGEDLLDYTINFAGTPNTRNAALYALRGVFGAFPGRFSSMPYYMKIQEYTNLESRDLWEYRLNLTQEQLDRLMGHVWELGGAYFPYYFFTDNCSYQLLALLEAAAPALRLTDGFGFGVVPADTVRALLRQKGLAQPARYRPSHVTLMLARRAALSPEEADAATALGRRGDEASLKALDGFAPRRQALTLDAGYDYFRYRAGFGPGESAESKRQGRRLLLRRERTGAPAMEPPAFPKAAPLEAGHETQRWSFGAGAADDAPFEDVSWRGALHDLADAPAGYIPAGELEMLDAHMRFNGKTREFYPETLDLVRIVSLSPWDRWVKKPSWDFAAGLDQAHEYGCSGWSCAYYGMNGGVGLAAETSLGPRVLHYALAGADAGLGPAFRRDWRLGAGGRGGMVIDLAPFWRAQLEASYYRYANGDDRPRQRLKLVNNFPIGKDMALRLTFERQTPRREAGLAFLLYQ